MFKVIVFTDLDGTLLHHYNYSWRDAIPALAKLESLSFPVVFVSSKTSEEIIQLKQEIGNHNPFISENGAVAGIPEHYFDNVEKLADDEKIEKNVFSQTHEEILMSLKKLREEDGYKFRGFSDMSVNDVIALTDLSLQQAVNARKREGSEPILWKDTKDRFEKFKSALDDYNLSITSGGRFHHVMGKVSKGDAIKWMMEKYKASFPDTQWKSIGLGDSLNDKGMLENVDYPVYVKNPATKKIDFSSITNLMTTELPGPSGWNKAVLELIKKITSG